MIKFENNVFIHLHKSGGTFVNNKIKSYFKFEKFGYHLPLKYLPIDHKEKNIFGTIRNPFDFYVSFYHFQKNSMKPNYVFKVFNENGKCNINETIKNMILCDEKHLNEIQNYAPDKFRNAGVNLTKNCLNEIKELNGGWYSRLFQRMYGDDIQNIKFLKMENLNEELAEYFNDLNLINNSQYQEILTAKKLNTSKHEKYGKYYNDDLIQLVYDNDYHLIKTFDYEF